MSEANCRPNGELQGDTRAIPNRGTGTGMGRADAMGMSLDKDATNRRGGIGGAAKSDPWDDTTPSDERTPGDRD